MDCCGALAEWSKAISRQDAAKTYFIKVTLPALEGRGFIKP